MDMTPAAAFAASHGTLAGSALYGEEIEYRPEAGGLLYFNAIIKDDGRLVEEATQGRRFRRSFTATFADSEVETVTPERDRVVARGITFAVEEDMGSSGGVRKVKLLETDRAEMSGPDFRAGS